MVVALPAFLFAKKLVQDWIKILRDNEVPSAPVNNLDSAFSEPPVAEREMIVEYEHPEAGKVRLPGNPIKFTDMGPAISTPAPMLGEHTDEILSSIFKLNKDEIKKLKDNNIIK